MTAHCARKSRPGRSETGQFAFISFHFLLRIEPFQGLAMNPAAPPPPRRPIAPPLSRTPRFRSCSLRQDTTKSGFREENVRDMFSSCPGPCFSPKRRPGLSIRAAEAKRADRPPARTRRSSSLPSRNASAACWRQVDVAPAPNPCQLVTRLVHCHFHCFQWVLAGQGQKTGSFPAGQFGGKASFNSCLNTSSTSLVTALGPSHSSARRSAMIRSSVSFTGSPCPRGLGTPSRVGRRPSES